MNYINSNEDFTIIKQKIIRIIEKYKSQMTNSLSADTVAHLATHLTIAIMRLQSKNYIPLSNSQLASIQENDIYAYAEKICQEIKQEFNIPFPKEEIAVITMYLTKSSILDLDIKSGFDLLDKEIFYVLKDTMTTIYKNYQYDFRNNDTLWITIGLHLTPAIERLKNHQMIENPLVNTVKKEYPLAYSLATILNYNIEKQYQLALSDDEIAFIAVHFLNAMQESTS